MKVIPKDYKWMMKKIDLQQRRLEQVDEATPAAFYDDRKSIEEELQPAVVY